MKSINKLFDRFFSYPKYDVTTTHNLEDGGDTVMSHRVYDFENKDLIELTERSNGSTKQDDSCPQNDSPLDHSKPTFSSQKERKFGNGKQAEVVISSAGFKMSRTSFLPPQTSQTTANYGDNHRPTKRVRQSFHETDSGKRRRSEDSESFQEIKRKRRKTFKPSTLAGQHSNSSIKPQSLGPPTRKLSLRSYSSYHLEMSKNRHRNSTSPDQSKDSTMSPTYRAKHKRIKSENQMHRLPQVPDRSPDRLIQILENQIFIHIRKAIKPFHKELPKKDRKEIGADAVRVIIEHPRFKKHFKANGNCILPDYEVLLAAQASSYVDERVRHILGDDIVNKLLNLPLKSHMYPTKSTRTDIQSRSSSTIPDSASEHEEIFCRPEKKDTRFNSFSPSTSLSTDPTDIETVKNSINSPCRFSVPSKTTRLTTVSNPTFSKPITRGIVKPQHQNLDFLYKGKASSRHRTLPRPYLRYHERKNILEKLKNKNLAEEKINDQIFPHVPLSKEEIIHILAIVKQRTKESSLTHATSLEMITDLMAGRIYLVLEITDSITYGRENFSTVKALCGRTRSDIIAFLIDAVNNTVSEYETLNFTEPSMIEFDLSKNSFNPINRLLRHREIDGLYPARIRRGQSSYREVVSSFLEDCLSPQSEWADCSNDIAAITWINNDAFIVGALTHSDPHNMQYNKPGNLLVGSVSQDTLKSYPQHKIERPIVSEHQNVENSLDSMRTTQSPWLYTSVVSSAHSDICGYSFTSSYDNTVKVWKVLEDGSGMTLHATWIHNAKVNFVVTSEHHDRVAIALGTSRNAVRVYHFDSQAIEESPYDEYGGNKSQEQSGDIHMQRPWAYQPATIKWARSSCIENLLLVGYSPRADSGDDSDIPDDKKNTGELCVWDSEDGTRFHVSSGRMQNVFDAVWHPTQPVFAVATSPFGNYDNDRTKTQVRILALNESTFTSIMTLDCPALDITELTLMPNNAIKLYVTASCTDGCTYVWDVAEGEDPIHILRHGESIDNPEPNLPLELADDGVTFSAWGADISRFYTGATDGKLIAWDIRKSPGNAFVRNVLELSGGISCGAFTKDFQKLLIGDSTGKIHLLGINDSEFNDDKGFETRPIQTRDVSQKLDLLSLKIRYPKIVIPHPEPSPPKNHKIGEVEIPYRKFCQNLLDEDIVRLYPGKGVFQGSNYHKSNLYRAAAHKGSDIKRPLKIDIISVQQFHQNRKVSLTKFSTLPCIQHSNMTVDRKRHGKNIKLNFDFSKLTLQTREELDRDRAEFDWDEDHTFEYELTPRSTIFGKQDNRQNLRVIETVGRRSRRIPRYSNLSMDEMDELAMGL